jgi:hypothetical protein
MTGISRRDDATYLAIDPETFQLSKRVMIRHKRLQYVAQQSLGASLEVDYLVKETLEKPLHVYQGLRFDRDEDKFEGQGWRCYCSAPEYPGLAHTKPWRPKGFPAFVSRSTQNFCDWLQLIFCFYAA